MVLIIAFLLIKISAIDESFNELIFVELEEKKVEEKKPDPKEAKMKIIPLPELSEEVRRNIAINTAEQLTKEISTEKYIEQLKQELNIMDPPDNWKEKLAAEYQEKIPEAEKQAENEKQAQYSGETNVTYNLKNRRGRLYIPVYKCQGGGKVVVEIIVNQQGKVIGTDINHDESLADDECLYTEAANAAIRSRFNADYDAPNRQKGSITYLFISQSY